MVDQILGKYQAEVRFPPLGSVRLKSKLGRCLKVEDRYVIMAVWIRYYGKETEEKSVECGLEDIWVESVKFVEERKI